jgi:hypothetical protein
MLVRIRGAITIPKEGWTVYLEPEYVQVQEDGTLDLGAFRLFDMEGLELPFELSDEALEDVLRQVQEGNR